MRGYDAVLLIAFGGPREPGEIRPFLERVLAGTSTDPSRMDEVAAHYEAVGGKSPLPEITFRQARALRAKLAERGLALGVEAAFRHSNPSIGEVLTRMGREGVRRVLAFVMAPHRSEASWGRYLSAVSAAQAESGFAFEIDYPAPWHAHPLFVRTWAEQLAPVLQAAAAGGRPSLVFTAHSIPVAMADRSNYTAEVSQSAELIARAVGYSRWRLAYQSRSGEASEAWLEPDLGAVLGELARAGERSVVVSPIGFICDHVEVLYDLDRQARERAEELGLGFFRAPCPNDHPTFIEMVAEIVEGSLRRLGPK